MMKLIPKMDLSTAAHIGLLLLTGAVFLLIAPFPLLGTLGFESGNLLVTAFGPLFILAAACNHRDRHKGFNQIFLRETMWLLVHIFVFGLLLFINGFYRQSCSLGSGILPFFIIAFPPLLLNVSLGAILSSALRNFGLKFLIFILGCGLYVAWQCYVWWQDPAFRLFTHASILMSSDLLEGDIISPAVLGFRSATLLLSLALILFGTYFLFNGQVKLTPMKNFRTHMGVVLIAVALVSHWVVENESLKAVGKTKADLRRDYLLLAEQRGVHIFGNPQTTSKKEAQQILDEALLYRERIKKRLGTISDAPLTIWLHRSDLEKFVYTGAKNVHFALPKHRELHISGVDTPHPVLGHELAHIFVGEVSETILGYPGLGIIPNLALTEGLAMVLAEELAINKGLSMEEQARALYQGNIKVDLVRLFSINPVHFATAHPHTSYVYAGATLTHLLGLFDENARPQKIRELIKGGSLHFLFNDEQRLSYELDRFQKSLSDAVPPYAVAWAQKFFPKASILTNDCRDGLGTEKADLSTGLLNNDIGMVRHAFETMPQSTAGGMLSKVIDEAMKSNAYDIALELIAQVETSIKSNGPELAELRLKKLSCLVNRNRFQEGSVLVHEIEDQFFSLETQRLILVLRAFFRNYTAMNASNQLSRAAIEYLFAKTTDQQSALANFSYHLGQDALNPVHDNDDIRPLAKYIFARFLVRAELKKQALLELLSIDINNAWLPHAIQREMQLMLASLYRDLGEYDASLATFDHLLSASSGKAEKLELADQLDRVKLRMEQQIDP